MIGVTGHRFLTEIEKLAQGVDQALERIASLAPGGSLTVLSSLAEGADMLVAQRALRRSGARIIVPLPLPLEEYRQDFDSADRWVEFQRLLAVAQKVIIFPDAGQRPHVYQVAEKYILEHCTALIALWDGKPAQGAGGTAEVVAQARARGLPIAWVHCGNRVPGTSQPVSLGAEQGIVSFENI